MTDISEMADRRLSEKQLERARTELQAERLRDCLTCEERSPLWAPMEAAWIMSGIHPEASADLSDPQGWALLPGALAFYGLDSRPAPHDLSNWDALRVGVERQLEAAGGLLIGTARPVEWIKAAKAVGIRLPWVQFARADRECAEMLPSSLFYEPGEDARPNFRKAQAVKGRARAKQNPSAKRIDGDGRRSSNSCSLIQICRTTVSKKVAINAIRERAR